MTYATERKETRGRKPYLTHLSVEERLMRMMEQHRVAARKHYYTHRRKEKAA